MQLDQIDRAVKLSRRPQVSGCVLTAVQATPCDKPLFIEKKIAGTLVTGAEVKKSDFTFAHSGEFLFNETRFP